MTRAAPSSQSIRMELRSRLAFVQRAETGCERPSLPPIAFGSRDVDARLGGGLAHATLHEFFAANPVDASALAGFAVLLTMRAELCGKPVIWVREDRGDRNNGRLYAQGLVELGADPARFTIIHAPDTLSLLRAGADIVKCSGVGAVFIEPWGKASELDLTASRRLSMAAARSGVMTLLLRSGLDSGSNTVGSGPEPARTTWTDQPSAATTRWRVGCAPSMPLRSFGPDIEPDTLAPGPPTFEIEMLRHRGGLPNFTARLEWNRDRNSFETSYPDTGNLGIHHDTPLSGDLPAVPAFGKYPDGGARAA